MDPIGYEGSRWNLYEYVDGCPTSRCDPTGNFVEKFDPVVFRIRDFKKGKRLLLAHCNSRPLKDARCTRAQCEKEVEMIMGALEYVWSQLEKEGGPTVLRWCHPLVRDCLGVPIGRVCHECADLVEELLQEALGPDGGKCFRKRRHEVTGPLKNGGTYDHCWVHIVPRNPPGSPITVDFWNPAVGPTAQYLGLERIPSDGGRQKAGNRRLQDLLLFALDLRPCFKSTTAIGRFDTSLSWRGDAPTECCDSTDFRRGGS